MKRLCAWLLCLLLVFSAAGCADADAEIRTGCYFLKSDGEVIMTPYLYMDLENNSAHLSGGMAMSYAETGTVTVDGTRILVETRPTTYVFRIQDENTLILADCTGENPFKLPTGAELVYNEEWS